MNHSDIASHYRETSARGSHPVGLVVKLYDAILEDLRRAMSAAREGDIPARTASLNHTLLIIAELQSVLDHERGGEVSRRLSGFYNVTRGLIVEANIRSIPEHFQRLIDLYLPLRQAWRQVEQAAAMGKLGADLTNSLPQTNSASIAPNTAPANSDTASGQWKA